MPRIRTIKPDFFLDEDIAALDPLDRLAFIGLWCVADKAGRLEDRPTRLSVQVLPYDRGDFSHRLDRLAAARFIIRYKDLDGRAFIQIRTWERHQRPHHTEQESDLPPCNGESTVSTPLPNGESTVRKGKERKGKEGRGAELDNGASPPPTETAWLEYVLATWPDWPKSDALAALGYYESRRWTGVKDWKGCAKTCYHRWAANGGGNGKRPRFNAEVGRNDWMPATPEEAAALEAARRSR